MKNLFPELNRYILSMDFSEIPPERAELLKKLGQFLESRKTRGETARFTFICTHNSRRSQLCQVWAQAAAHYYGFRDFEAASGGTEVTAFHPQAVRALKDCGFRINIVSEPVNPRYEVHFSEVATPVYCYSKKFTETWPHPTSFAAVLNCSEADAECPFIPEAEARFALRYEDPKKSDGTDQEKNMYSRTNRQIATEIFYLFSQVS